jgi:competence protein ComEA
MRAAEAACRAAFAVACVLYALALPPVGASPQPCEEPVEHSARNGHTSAVRCGPAPASPPLRGPVRRLFGLPLDPNRADAPTLESLPGVGPVRAAAIVQARERRPFESVEALLRVPGVGPVTLSRVAPLLAVDTAAGTGSGGPTRSPRPGVRGPEGRR